MKLVLILLICIIVLLVLCLVTNKNNENFSNYNSLNKHFTFLSSDEACDLIKDIDYFQNLNKRDILARKYIANKNTILENYCSGFLDFTESDKKKIKSVLEQLENNELFKSWSFAKIDTEIENGYPHTHKDTIFLSSQTINDTPKILQYILVHEQMHVMQRKKPALFAKLYLEYFPFKSGKLNLESSIVNSMRSNPDTRLVPDNEFIYVNDTDTDTDEYYYLCALYTSEVPSGLGDVDYVAIKLTYDNNTNVYTGTDKIVEIIKLNNYNNFFRLTGNHYHPNEISAELIALHYSNKNEEPSQALIKTGMWIKDNIV